MVKFLFTCNAQQNRRTDKYYRPVLRTSLVVLLSVMSMWSTCFTLQARAGSLTIQSTSFHSSGDRKMQISEPIQVNGASFEAIVDPVWKIPALSDTQGVMIHLVLRVMNQTSSGLYFNRFDTIRLNLMDAQGHSLQFDGGRNAVRPGEIISPLLMPQHHLDFSRNAQLIWTKDKALRLIGSDDFGGIWYFDGLKPGKYRLEIHYESHKPVIANTDAIWVGTATTKAVELVLEW